MKPSGYLLTRKNGDKSGTAHRSCVDFWLGKDDHVQPMYSSEEVMSMLYDVWNCIDGRLTYDTVKIELEYNQRQLTEEIEHTKKVLSEKKQQPRVAGVVIP